MTELQAIERVGSTIKIVDQTALPATLEYRELATLEAVIEAIRTLRVRGAPAIGIAAAYGLAQAAELSPAPSLKKLTVIADRLKAARPTAVNLAWAVDRCLGTVQSNAQDIVDRLWQEAEAIHDEDRQMCSAIGRHGCELIPGKARILTHCNTGALATGGIGTALGVIVTAHHDGRVAMVYADETRPLLQGARLTMWELKVLGIPARLITDSTAGMLMGAGRVDLVIVGADRIARNGDTANKIGTYALAVLAAHHQVPFYVAAPSSTFDERLADGSGIPIEERAASEITEGFGARTAPSETDVYAPAFDVTPGSLITAFVTEQGIRPGGRKN